MRLDFSVCVFTVWFFRGNDSGFVCGLLGFGQDCVVLWGFVCFVVLGFFITLCVFFVYMHIFLNNS